MKFTASWGLSLAAGTLLSSVDLTAASSWRAPREPVMQHQIQALAQAPAPTGNEAALQHPPLPASPTPAPSAVPAAEAPAAAEAQPASVDPHATAMPPPVTAAPPMTPPPPVQNAAESVPSPAASSSGNPGAAPAPLDPNELPPPKIPKKLHFTAAQIKQECRKFEGKFIAYYDRVFKVEGCKRREVVSDDDEENPVLRGQRVVPVENLTVAKIPEGPAIGSSPKGKKPNCARVEGRYIISRASDVFFVEHCKKRPFPDWDTYEDHSSKRNKKNQELLELTEEEFLALPIGPEFKSSLNDEYKKMLVTEKGVDILPIDEACKGLNGSYLSYYAKIYKVERCRKHEVDAERFLQRFPNYKLREMSSEQWVSIPTGKPVKL